MSAAQTILDRVRTLAGGEALAADPAPYIALLVEEAPPATTLAELETRDAFLVTALHRIDELAARVMRIALDQVLADDTSIGAPTRKVFASTIANYANDLSLLAQRVRDLAQRGGAAHPDDVADAVLRAASTTLQLRDTLRTSVFALIRDLATVAIPFADKHARDRELDEPRRKRWSAARRDLEALVEEPARILVAPMAARMAAWPEQLDEPPAEPEKSFAEMIEID